MGPHPVCVLHIYIYTYIHIYIVSAVHRLRTLLSSRDARAISRTDQLAVNCGSTPMNASEDIDTFSHLDGSQ